MQRMLTKPQDLYAIDLLCDAEVQLFYMRLGMMPACDVCVRNYARQAGRGDNPGGGGRICIATKRYRASSRCF